MENLDASVIVTALPAMGQDFGVEPARLSSGISAYLIALTIFIPVSGWISDRFGARRVFTCAIAAFSLSSLLCAASSDLLTFTLARALQGLSGAMMVPVGKLLVIRDTPKKELMRTVAILTWPALLGPVTGPLIGGWLTTTWSWHWIFLLNLPVGIIALVAALILIRPQQKSVTHFDLYGFLLLGSCFGLLMGGIEGLSHGQSLLLLSLVSISSGLILLYVCSLYLSRARQPLISLNSLKVKTFRITVTGGSVSRITLGCAPFLLPLTLQLGFGYSAVEAGSIMMWLFAGNLAMRPATSWFMDRIGFRRILLFNTVLIMLSYVAYACLTSDTPYVAIATILFFTGMVRSVQFMALHTLAFADVEGPDIRDANTLFSVMQRLNNGVGIALAALALSLAEWWHNVVPYMNDAGDFRLAFLIIAAISLLPLISIGRLNRQAGISVLRGKDS